MCGAHSPRAAEMKLNVFDCVPNIKAAGKGAHSLYPNMPLARHGRVFACTIPHVQQNEHQILTRVILFRLKSEERLQDISLGMNTEGMLAELQITLGYNATQESMTKYHSIGYDQWSLQKCNYDRAEC